MSVAILGGLDRMKRFYENTGRDFGFKIKFFGQRVPDMEKRLAGVDGIILLTGTISHPMVREATRLAKKMNINLGRSHSSGVSSLKRCLRELAWA